MFRPTLTGCLVWLVLHTLPLHLCAQTANIAKISQIITFAGKGNVTTSAAAGTKPGANSAASSSSGTPASKSLVAEAGATVDTDADAASSLVLGALGTARMQADTQVKVPEAAESTHSLELLKGSLFLNIDAAELKKGVPNEFKLKTPVALLAVKGTRFFAISKDGEDLIGVHAGKIVVQVAAGTASLELLDGTVVPVTAAGLGVPRPMTSDEQTTSAEYDLANVIRRPAKSTVGWAPLKARAVAGGPKPELLPDGNARFTWSLASRESLNYLRTDFRHELPTDQAGKPLALELRLRAVGTELINLGLTDESQKPPQRSTRMGIDTSAAEWRTVIIPFPGQGTPNSSHTLYATFFPAVRTAADSMQKKGALEIQPVQLLLITP